MEVKDIAFPNLHIYLTNVPRSFSIFGFEIMLYGVIIAAGILLGLCVAAADQKRHGLDPNTIWDVAIYGIPAGIIGARIYYVIFYWESYRDNPLSMFNLRAGGLAIYGGVIGAILTVLIYTRIKKLSFFATFDSISLGFLVGQIIGRWGNFFNREVFGGYTDNFFAMRLPIDAVRARDISPALRETIVEGTNYIQVHPTFLYEGLWNLAVLAALWFYSPKKKFNGQIFCLYIALYGVGRFWIEYIRTDRLYIGNTNIPVSMVVSVAMILVSFIIAFIQKKQVKH
ncbi:MAG: prolipoprotein diacylglyceryl transferase [Lachnospiraceae bacterium]|nr:prolipoprotein diacylglyceryl transferase [Lachnospiraceae bacterium]